MKRMKIMRISVDVSVVPVSINSSVDFSSFLQDIQVVEDFNDFVTSVELLLEVQHGFTEVTDSHSDRPDSISHYFECIKYADDGTQIKCLLFLRISDHLLEKDRRRKQREYFKKKIQDKQTKTVVDSYKIKSIILNDEQYEDYDSALAAIDRKLDEWNV